MLFGGRWSIVSELVAVTALWAPSIARDATHHAPTSTSISSGDCVVAYTVIVIMGVTFLTTVDRRLGLTQGPLLIPPLVVGMGMGRRMGSGVEVWESAVCTGEVPESECESRRFLKIRCK